MKNRFVFLVVLALVLVCAGTGYAQQTAEELYQAGLYQEEVQGDLERAIGIYQTILSDHAGSRAVAAKAQLHIGICYETLGLQEAQQAYQRVVANFGEQSDAVSQARARLAVLSQHAAAVAATGRVARMLLSDEETDINHFFDMQASPDGRRIVYTDLGYTGAVYIRDLATGDTTKVADGWSVSPIWSPDGKRIAFSTVKSREPRHDQLSILDLATGEKTTPAAVQHLSLTPVAWSPSSDLLVCEVEGGPRNLVLALVSFTGDTTTLATYHQYWSAAFSPDGQYVAYSDVLDGNVDVYVRSIETGERHRITTGPEEEGYPRWSPTGDVLMYTTRNAGMWAVPIDGGTASAAPRLLTSERYDQPAGWAESGQYFYVKYNRVQQLLRIPVDQSSMTAAGPPEHMPILQDELGGFRWSPDMQKIAVCRQGKITIYSSEGRELRAVDASDCRITAPTWSLDGSELYFTSVDISAAMTSVDTPWSVNALDISSGAIRELVPPIPGARGLRASADGQRMLFHRGIRSSRENQLVVADVGNPDGAVFADEAKMEDGRLARWVRPGFTLDGSKVLFGTQGHRRAGRDSTYQLWVAPADGSEEPRRIAAAHWIPFATWHPAGTHVVYNTWEEEARNLEEEKGPVGLYVLDMQSGEQSEIELPSGLEISRIVNWSPDGKWIGVVSGSGSYELWVVDNVLSDRAGSR